MLAALSVAGASTVVFAQITPIYDIQYTTDPSGDSPLVGQIVTVEGVVTAAQFHGFYVSDAPGPWSSIFVYTRAAGCGVALGDAVTVIGVVDEYYGMTEIIGHQHRRSAPSAWSPPAATRSPRWC